MAEVIGNGTTIALGQTEMVDLLRIDPDDSGIEIDVSHLGDDVQVFEVGQSERGIEVETIGAPAWTLGQRGNITITVPGGAADNRGRFVVMAAPKKIALNSPVTYVTKLKPCRAATP